MKKTLTIIAVMFCISLNAQSDTSIVRYGDTIKYSKGAILIEPVVVDAQGNYAYSITWNAFDVTQDTTKGCNTYVILHGKNNEQLTAFNQPIPASVVNVWVENTVIDNYILLQNPRFVQIPYLSKK